MFKNHTPLYRQIIREAWQITWHHPTIWFFGLFSAFIATGGAIEIFSHNLKWILTPHLPFFAGYEKLSWNAPITVWPLLIMLVLICFGFLVFIIFMSVRSFIALIAVADKHKAGEKIDLDKMWQLGDKKFLTVFGEVAVLKIIIFLAGILSIFPLWLIWLGNNWQGWLWLYPILFILGAVITVTASFLMVLIADFLVLKRYTFGKSIKMAWQLFIKNWLACLEMALLIFLINIVFGLLYLVGVILIAIPAFLFLILGWLFFLPILSQVALFLGVLACSLLAFFLAGFLGAFHTIAWTLLYKKMEEGIIISKLHRLVNNLLRK